jgi:type II secretory pathway component PulF
VSSPDSTGANGRHATSATPASTASGQSPEEIQRDIEQTRAQLGETAGALAHKLDPKAQAKERMGQARRSAQDLYRERPAVVIGVAVAAVVLAAVIWRRNS